MEEICQNIECLNSEESLLEIEGYHICRVCLYKSITLNGSVNPFTGNKLCDSILYNLEQFIEDTRYWFVIVNTAIEPFKPGRKVDITIIWYATIADLIISVYSHYPNLILYTRLQLPNGKLLDYDTFSDKCNTLDDGERFNRINLVKGVTTGKYLTEVMNHARRTQCVSIANVINNHFKMLMANRKPD